MAPPRSDALVVFGVTGDLAHKMIFPALYGMVKRGELEVPVVGVAFPNQQAEGWWALLASGKGCGDGDGS